ncbi:Lcl C-terminal domain-containing protein [Pseudomonas fluorescens group sp. PF-1]
MKPEMITLKHGDTTIKMPSSSLAKLAMASVFAQVLPPAANVQPVATEAPALGEYWAGQGGYNGGLIEARGEVPAHYLIIAKKDVGDHKWGGRDKESAAFSKTDGMANTLALIAEGDHPAAKAASAYSADGHADFYLPACAELYQGWLNCPEVFAQDCYYWSSTQRSADGAFGMYFADGTQYSLGKSGELRVRPVRRLFI